MLYPLKFRPRLKERIWGGDAIVRRRGRCLSRVAKDRLYGESWDISTVKGDVSVVANGMLKGNNLRELIEVYMGDLVGEDNFMRFGLEFPLLIKYLDCNDKLSVQVHPDDALAEERHGSYGKTEAWYIADCKPGAALYLGFKNRNITREEYIEAVAEQRLEEMLNRIEVKPGDLFFIPAGTVHALGAGIEVVEVQQTSDITYRIYDWNRVDAEGNSRELHTALAVDAIDFESGVEECLRRYEPKPNEEVEIVKCDHFTTSMLEVRGVAEMDYAGRDSFTIYICLEGEVSLDMEGEHEHLSAGEVVLIPASANEVVLSGQAKLLTTYI